MTHKINVESLSMSSNFNKIVFIVGPTGVGKSSVALELASQINGEIVSADSMQVYRELTVASDKPTLEMQKQVPHHMVDVVSVEEEFDVVKFRDMSEEAIKEILALKKIPIVVGGSGMYVSVLLDGIFADVGRDDVLRTRFEKLAELEGNEALHQRLRSIDPDAAAKIHPNDLKRIVRAMEVFAITGKPISQLQKKREGLWGQYNIVLFGLIREREELYRRVEERIDCMFASGLIEEIRDIQNKQLTRTVQGLIGIPEVKGFLDGEYNLDRAKYLMKRNTRHYVKRQLTWFRKEERIQWIDVNQIQNALYYIKKEIS